MAKKHVIAAVMLSTLLASCGNNAEEDLSSDGGNLLDEINSVNTDATNVKEGEKSSGDMFTKNTSESTSPSTPISADEESSKMLFEAGSDVRNEWFYQQLEDAGVQEDRSRMIELRSEVCSQLTSGKTIDSISNDLTLKNYTAHQQGVIIASSMVSQCSDSPVIVDQNMANSVKQADKK